MTEFDFEGDAKSKGQEQFDRTPEHGWDASVDVRQGRRFLREHGDKVRAPIIPGAAFASDLADNGRHFPTDDDRKAQLKDDLAPYVHKLRAFGLRPRTVVKMLVAHFRERIDGGDFDAKFIAAVLKSVYVNAATAPGRDSAAGDRVPDGMAFATDNNGKPKNTPGNLAIAFVRLGVSFSYDKFADRYMIHGLKEFEGELSDAAVNQIRFRVDSNYKFLPDKTMAFDFCYDFARYYSRDPVCDYFDKVQDKWDRKPRIKSFLTDYAGAEDSPYVREVSQLFFMAVVRRNREPGAKFDEMIVLESPQGKNKSSALALLATNPNYFSDSFPMNADNRETLEHAKGKIIIEVPELQGMRKADVEHVKAMLSRQTDQGRMAYARTQTEVPRRFVFVGTSNGRNYLMDSTGNRRFWPVAIHNFDLAAIRRDRDQLWGEAAWRDALGVESIRMVQDLWEAAGIEQDKRAAAFEDPFTETLRDELGDMAGRITAADAWDILGIEPGRRTPEMQRRFGAAFKALGWRPVTVALEPGKHGRTGRGYGKGNSARRIIANRSKEYGLSVYYEDDALEGLTGESSESTPDFG